MKNKIVIASDSFKGSLSSSEISQIARLLVQRICPSYQVVSIPFADGGEGTVEAFINSGDYFPVKVKTVNGLNEPITAVYGYDIENRTAVIEMASAAGLTQIDHKDVENTSTYGVGKIILHAVTHGAKRILLGLGGSCTNDGGCGAAAALGVQFINKNEENFIPVGRTLKDIEHIDVWDCLSILADTEIRVMCDVKNPLTGDNGASAVFGPQKGANPEQVKMLDAGLKHLAQICRQDLNIDIEPLEGAGAAGGMGGGTVAFFKGKLQSGVESIMEITHFDQLLEEAALVITGEGQLDKQSFQGKVIDGVLSHCLKKKVDVIGIVGQIKDEITAEDVKDFLAVYETNPEHRPFEEIKASALEDYFYTFEAVLENWKTSV